MNHSSLAALALAAALVGCSTAGSVVDTENTAETIPEVDLTAGHFEGTKQVLGIAPDDLRAAEWIVTGPKTSGLSSTNRVWEATRDWDAVETEAGMAWAANSGLNWEEKYAAWVDSLEKTTSVEGHQTVEIVTPWGLEIQGPRVECSEMGMFLRGLFASWYNLPFFMTAYSSAAGGNVHYGHFGIVTSTGAKVSGTANYKTAYTDHTASFAGDSNADILANWPDDAALETKSLTNAQEDAVEFLGADAYFGAYIDELVLNKRAGHFLVKLLEDMGSIHFASQRNLWNIEADAIRPGDILLHRWQASGIGHVMVIKEVQPLTGGNLDVSIAYGSMPRIQPVWYDTAIAKSYFTSDYAGSAELDSNGTAYSQYGGGAKRWRTAKISGSNWTNQVLADDQDVWIESTDYPTLEARTVTYKSILGELTPTEQRDALLEQIEMARTNLAKKPASCANRERREQAFDDLYELMSDEWGWTQAQVDAEYREFEDWIFAELEYGDSKTCCWNSTTAEMYDIVVDYNTELVEDAHDAGQCVDPVVFMATGGGKYDTFADYAADTNRAAQWLAWSEDETCPQKNVSADTVKSEPATDFCDLAPALMGWETAECPSGGTKSTWYADTDGDGYGSASSTTQACSAPSGYVANDDDCNNSYASIRPGAAELCDGFDNDCDNTVDEGCPTDSGNNGGNNGGNTGNNGNTTPPDSGCGCAGQAQGPVPAFLTVGLGLAGLARRRRVV